MLSISSALSYGSCRKMREVGGVTELQKFKSILCFSKILHLLDIRHVDINFRAMKESEGISREGSESCGLFLERSISRRLEFCEDRLKEEN